MLSSISNSNPEIRPPELPYIKVVLLAFLVAGLMFAGAETALRKKGYLPNVEDTQLFWAIKRNQVYSENGRKKIVIIGGSRSHLDLVPEIFRQEFPAMDVIDLAMDAKAAYSTLKDLAEDPRFDGWIICDTPAWGGGDESQKPDVDYYHRYFDNIWGRLAIIDREVNTRIKARLQQRFVLMSPYLKYQLATRKRPIFIYMDWDRARRSYYRTKTVPGEKQQVRRKRLLATFANADLVFNSKMEEWTQRFSENVLREFKKLMDQKGGKIFLVRLPTSEERWALDEFVYPKRIWNQIEGWSGIPTIHFKDDEVLASFTCPDTSHLDALDAPIFTRRLIQIIKLRAGETPNTKV